MIDILIPTLNEAEHITEAVANASLLGNVFVLDSFSTDGTQNLAHSAGAIVVEHTFTNYAAQKNWGIENLPWTGQWIFILDADERITPALRDEIRSRLTKVTDINGYYANRLLLFMGQSIRHGGLYPSWNLRLFRRGSARYEERSVHEHMICNGRTAYLHNEMLHVRKESITEYLRKHIRYADMESDEWIKRWLGQSKSSDEGSLFQHALKYRQLLRRRIWPKLPFRPMWRFFYMYLVRLGFLDGKAGWHLARLMSNYEYMISLMYTEKRLRIIGTFNEEKSYTNNKSNTSPSARRKR